MKIESKFLLSLVLGTLAMTASQSFAVGLAGPGENAPVRVRATIYSALNPNGYSGVMLNGLAELRPKIVQALQEAPGSADDLLNNSSHPEDILQFTDAFVKGSKVNYFFEKNFQSGDNNCTTHAILEIDTATNKLLKSDVGTYCQSI